MPPWKIRESKLYRVEFKTFEDYCRDKWQISRTRAFELIEASNTVKSLPENVRHGEQISNERQARELAKVEPAKREAVVERAVDMSSGKSAKDQIDPQQNESLNPQNEGTGKCPRYRTKDEF